MNHIFRVVFCHSKNTWVAVSELARGRIKQSSQKKRTIQKRNSVTTFGYRKLILSLLVTQACSHFFITPALAEIQKDPNSPEQMRPTLLVTENGVPLINIQTPNAQGLSHNQFLQLNVGAQGAILNNSQEGANTYLAGHVAANPWLAQSTAQTILNEVTGPLPSSLGGHIEVAGKPADVIIANPNGITCNGCGFINAQQTTLTTGLPEIQNGNLSHYQVTQGTITIGESGLNDSGSQYTKIISDAVVVNGAIHAQDLTVISGEGKVSHDGQVLGTTSSSNTDQSHEPKFSLDVSHLGGMYAGKITLVGTESGLGVRNSGQIGATSGEITITSDGKLVNTGLISATTNVTLQSQKDIENTGTIYSEVSTHISSEGHIDNSSVIAAGEHVSIDAHSFTQDSAGLVLSGADSQFELNKTGSIELNANALTAQGQLIATDRISMDVDSAQFNNAELQAGSLNADASQNISLTNSQALIENNAEINVAGTLSNNNSQLAADQIDIKAESLNNRSGEITSLGEESLTINIAGDIDNQDGYIATNSNKLTLNSANLNNQHGQILQTADDAQMTITTGELSGQSGSILTQGELTISASGHLDLTSAQTTGSQIHIEANKVTNSLGRIEATGQLLTINSNSGIINQQGYIHSAGAIQLTANGLLDNKQGHIQASTISIGGNTLFLDNQQGVVTADHLTISGNAIDNTAGLLSADHLTVNLEGHLNNSGTLGTEAGLVGAQSLNLNVGSLDNKSGDLSTAGDLTLTTASLDNSAGGQIISGHDLLLNVTGELNNAMGLLQAQSALNITAGNLNNDQGILFGNTSNIRADEIDNEQGKIFSEDALTISAINLNNQQGDISAKTLEINSTAINNTKGQISAEVLHADAHQLTNTEGKIQAQDISIAHANIVNTHGVISGDILNLQTAEVDNTSGSIHATQSLTLNTQGNKLLNRNSAPEGGINSQGTLALEASDIDNQSGIIAAEQGIAINATSLSNHRGQILSQDSLAINAEGLNNAEGLIHAAGELNAQLSGSLENTHQGVIASTNTLQINADAIINTQGKFQSDAHVIISGAQIDNTGGHISATESLTISAIDTLTNAAQGIVVSGDNIHIEATNLNNQTGLIQSLNDIYLNVQNQLDNSQTTNQGGIQTQGRLTILADAFKNVIGKIFADEITITSHDINNNQGTIGANNTLNATAQSFDNSEGQTQSGNTTNIQSDELNNQAGEILATQQLTINTQGHRLDNQSGTLAASYVALETGELNNLSGLIQSNTSLSIDTGSDNLVNSQGGRIASLGELQIATHDIDNQGGDISSQEAMTVNATHVQNNQGRLISVANLNLTTQTISNQQGAIQAGENLQLDSANSVDNAQGLISAINHLTLNTTALNNQGTQSNQNGIIARDIDLTASTLNNQQGHISATQDLTANLSSDLNNNAGTIWSGGALDIRRSSGNLALNNDQGVLATSNTMNIDVTDFSGAGSVYSSSGLTINLKEDYLVEGEMAINGDLRIQLEGKLTNKGTLFSSGIMTLQTDSIENHQGAEISAQELNINTGSLLNHGLIDAINTTIKVNDTFYNLHQGRVYGNYLRIDANSLFNDGKSTIAARENLLIGVDALYNRDESLVFAYNNLLIGRNTTSDGTQGQAGHIENIRSGIESLGNLHLSTAQLINRDDQYQITSVSEGTTHHREYDPASWEVNRPRNVNNGWIPYRIAHEKVEFNAQQQIWLPFYADDYYIYDFDRTITTQQLTNQTPARIVAAVDLTIQATQLTNEQSQIIAGNQLNLAVNTLDNIEQQLTRYTTNDGTVQYTQTNANGREYYPEAAYYTQDIETVTATGAIGIGAASTSGGVDPYSGSGQGGSNTPTDSGKTPVRPIDITMAALNPIDIYAPDAGQTGVLLTLLDPNGNPLPGQPTIPEPTIDPVTTPDRDNTDGLQTLRINNAIQQIALPAPGDDSYAPSTIVRTGGDITLPQSSLFTLNSSPDKPLLQTDYRFAAGFDEWFYNNPEQIMAGTPGHMIRRVGDSFVEQRLIQQQITQLTGQRYLSGFSDDQTQYTALLQAGETFRQAHNLTPGISLSAEQMAHLTSDIIWLEERQIRLPDGSVETVIVPQVYALIRNETDLTGQGALLSGRNIQIGANQISNSGQFKASETLTAHADDIQMTHGQLQGDSVDLQAKHDLLLASTQIQANRTVNLQAGNDLTLNTQTHTSQQRTDRGSEYDRTTLDTVTTIRVNDTEGKITLKAGHDLTLSSAAIINTGEDSQTTLLASNDININSVETRQRDAIVFDSRNGRTDEFTQTHHTAFVGGGDLTLQADQDINLLGVNVTQDGHLQAQAGRDITLSHTDNYSGQSRQIYTASSGFLSSSTVEIHGSREQHTSQLSQLSAEQITLKAGQDINVTGSTLVADQDLTLNAGRHVEISAAQNTLEESSFANKHRSGLMRGGNFGVFIGNQQQTDTIDESRTQLVSSALGSLNGDVSIQAGGDVTLTASDIIATKGDINLSGENVTLTSADNLYTRDEQHLFKQTGLTLSVSGGVIDTINTIDHSINRINQSGDSRLQALHAWRVSNAIGNALKEPTPPADGADKTQESPTAGMSISLSLGSSQSEQNRQLSQTTAQGSTLTAEGDIHITARGHDDNPDSGDLISRGSLIQAGNNITLDAADDIQLLSAENHESDNSTNESSSAGIGLTFGGGSLVSVNVSASASRGVVNQSHDQYLETTLTAGHQVEITSGVIRTWKAGRYLGNRSPRRWAVISRSSASKT